jgi:glycerophosphoryl diester phosphodiesterase
VPRLADLLDLSVTMPVIVEIKGDDPRVAGRAVDVVLAANAADRVVFAGFSHDVLGAVRARSASLATSASKDEVRAAVRRAYFRLAPRRPRYRVFQAPRRFGGRRVLTPALVGALGRVGVPVQAWIVDEASDMRELLAWGVRGLISDHPDRALAVIHERRS